MTPLVEPVIARLEAQVSDLAGRVRGAADLATLMAANGAPQAGVSAFVLPGGTEAAPPDRATGAHVQPVARSVAVVLLFRAGDPAANRTVDAAEALVAAVVRALAGWVPPGALAAPMEFRRQRPPTLSRGILLCELAFAAADRLRVDPEV